MKPLGLKLETKLFQAGCSIIIGCDEVGRGALAGPIVAGAVAWKPESRINPPAGGKESRKIQDSKLLSEVQRQELEIHIKHNSLAWGVGMVNSSDIDKINIHQANLLAIERAVNNLVAKLPRVAQKNYPPPQLSSRASLRTDLSDEALAKLEGSLHYSAIRRTSVGMTDDNISNIYLLIDGKFVLPKWTGKQLAVVDGDARIFSIASASILAKVHRDRLMMKLDQKFPEYGFGKHKGYGTSEHRKAILKNGMSIIHRQTFCRNIDAWRAKTV